MQVMIPTGSLIQISGGEAVAKVVVGVNYSHVVKL